MAREGIDIVISETGSRTVKRSLDDIGATADKNASSLDALRAEVTRVLGASGALSAASETLTERIRSGVGAIDLHAAALDGLGDAYDTTADFAKGFLKGIEQEIKAHEDMLAERQEIEDKYAALAITAGDEAAANKLLALNRNYARELAVVEENQSLRAQIAARYNEQIAKIESDAALKRVGFGFGHHGFGALDSGPVRDERKAAREAAAEKEAAEKKAQDILAIEDRYAALSFANGNQALAQRYLALNRGYARELALVEHSSATKRQIDERYQREMLALEQEVAQERERIVGQGGEKVASGLGSSTRSMFAWKREAAHSREAAQFLSQSISTLVPMTSTLGIGLRGAAAAALAAGGPMFALVAALEAVRFAGSLVTDHLEERKRKEEEAKKATEDHAQALRDIQGDLDDYLSALSGASPILTDLNRQMRDLDKEAAPTIAKFEELSAVLAEMPVGALGDVEEKVAALQQTLDRIEERRAKLRSAAIEKNAAKAAADEEAQRLEDEAELTLALSRADAYTSDQASKRREKARAEEKAYQSWRQQTLLSSLDGETKILAEFSRDWEKLRAGDLDTAYALIDKRDKALLALEVENAERRAEQLARLERDIAAADERAADEYLAGALARADRRDLAAKFGAAGGDYEKAEALLEQERTETARREMLEQSLQELPELEGQIQMALTRLVKEGEEERRRILGQTSFAAGFREQLTWLGNDLDDFAASAGATLGSITDDMIGGFAEATARGIAFSENVGDALENLARNALAEVNAALMKMLIQFGINSLIGSLGASATGPGLSASGSNWVSGSGGVPTGVSLPGRAGGGPVSAGAWLIGEDGPEVLTLGPGVSGNVIPNHALGAPQPLSLTVQSANTCPSCQRTEMREIARETVRQDAPAVIRNDLQRSNSPTQKGIVRGFNTSVRR